ncbi:MAG: LPS-assembly protein LptD [Deltaproteobacteria bacterium]|nr:LPS-assembly protein LptD [Deltaproteobacteria bacterium]
MQKYFLEYLFSFIFSLFIMSSSYGAQPFFKSLKQDSKIQYNADDWTYNLEKKMIFLKGHVVFGYGKDRVSADSATVDLTKEQAVVEGHVVLAFNDGSRVEADKIVYNYKTQLALVKNGRILSGQSIISAKDIEKTGPRTYELNNGYWTSCDHCEGQAPDWKIWGSHTTATLEEYGKIYNAVFFIKRVPVFWLPLIMLPIKQKRQTGILFPQLSFGEDHGIALLNQFFWAFSEHQDATLGYHFYEKRGHKLGLEYRFIPFENYSGHANAYFLDDKKFEKTLHEDRMAFLFRHSWDMNQHLYHRIRSVWVSDDEYVQDFPKEAPFASEGTIESNFLADWHTTHTNLSAEIVHYEDLLTVNPEGKNDQVVHKFPEVAFSTHPFSLHSTIPLFFDFESSFVNFQNLGNDNFVDDNNDGVYQVADDTLLKAYRFDFFPRVNMPVSFGIFELVPEAGIRETLYNKSTDRRWDGRNLFRGKINFLTNIQKVFEKSPESDIVAVRHLFEPRLEYMFIPEFDQVDLPQFDGVDVQTRRNEVTWYLTNWIHLKQRTKAEPEKSDLKKTLKEMIVGQERQRAVQDFIFSEVVELRLFQTLNIQKIMDNEPKPFESLVGKLEATYGGFKTLIEGQADTNDWFMKSVTSQFQYSDPWSNTYGLNYNFKREAAEDIQGSIQLGFIKWLKLFGSTKYSFVNDRFLEHKAGFKLLPLSKCWSFQFDFVKSVDQDLLFQAGMTLIFGVNKEVSIIEYQEQGTMADYNLLPGFRSDVP